MSENEKELANDNLREGDSSTPSARRRLSFHKEEDVARIADGIGKEVSDCGDTVEFFVQLDGDTVKEVTCRVGGCTNTFAGARAAVILTKGKTIQEAFKSSTPAQIGELALLPEEHEHAAEMASTAIRAALKNAVIGSREPWRRLYRRN
jgi:nitrogen fixation NifU-like protein